MPAFKRYSVENKQNIHCTRQQSEEIKCLLERVSLICVICGER